MLTSWHAADPAFLQQLKQSPPALVLPALQAMYEARRRLLDPAKVLRRLLQDQLDAGSASGSTAGGAAPGAADTAAAEWDAEGGLLNMTVSVATGWLFNSFWLPANTSQLPASSRWLNLNLTSPCASAALE